MSLPSTERSIGRSLSFPYATFTVGGHQYTAQEGDIFEIDYCGEGQDYRGDLADHQVADTQDLVVNQVHVVCTEDGTAHVGPEALAGAEVQLKVLSHTRQPKIIVFKKKRRKKYRKMSGHKQPVTKVELVRISLGSSSS